MRVIAVDWSGDARDARRRIWLAEAAGRRVLRLESGRGPEELAAHLIEEGSRTPATVVGLDFAFSFPAWFLEGRGLTSARQLWELADREGERWLALCEPPFWGRRGRRRPDLDEHFRRTELEVPAVGGIRPKSVFQVGGAGAVGTGSVRGMRLLYRLASAGFSIWPFDPVAWPRIVEIYPRALTGAVIKSRPEARAAFLRDRAVELDAPLLEKAVSSEDAFDAVVSALEMALHVEELEALEPVSDPRLVLEGVIWLPRRARIPAGGRSTAGDASNRPRPRGLPRPEPLAGATSALDASARGVHGGGAPRTSQSHPSRSH